MSPSACDVRSFLNTMTMHQRCSSGGAVIDFDQPHSFECNSLSMRLAKQVKLWNKIRTDHGYECGSITTIFVWFIRVIFGHQGYDVEHQRGAMSKCDKPVAPRRCDEIHRGGAMRQDPPRRCDEMSPIDRGPRLGCGLMGLGP